MKIKSYCNFWSGVMFIVVGLAFAAGATHYPFGTSARPGPGYFPLGLGLLLALLGSGVLLQALGTPPQDEKGKQDAVEHIGPWAWRPMFIISGAVVLFGALLPYLGLVGALPILVILTGTSVHDFRWISVLASAIVLTVASYLIFVYGLNLTLPVWPSFI